MFEIRKTEPTNSAVSMSISGQSRSPISVGDQLGVSVGVFVGDGVGLGVDWVLEPINTLYSDKLETFVWIRRGADIVHSRAQVIGALDQIERTSVDLYASVRSLYLQSRASTIRDEATNVDDLPDIDLLDWESDS